MSTSHSELNRRGVVQGEPRGSVWVGMALMVTGLLVLAANLGWLRSVLPLTWAALLLLAGAGMTLLFLSSPGRWWALIPAGALVGAGLAAASGGALWGGAAMLGSLGAGFLMIATTVPERWWALIPGGALVTLAAVTLHPGTADSGAALFLGLALTFGAVSLTAPGRRWALYPAAALLTLSLMTAGWFAPAAGYVWPLALIAVGTVILLQRGVRR